MIDEKIQHKQVYHINESAALHPLGWEKDECGEVLQRPIVPPDVDEIDRRLANCGFNELPESLQSKFLRVWREMLWWLNGDSPRLFKGKDAFVGRRCMAFTLKLDPEYYGGKSLREVCRAINVNPAAISKNSAEAEQKFSDVLEKLKDAA